MSAGEPGFIGQFHAIRRDEWPKALSMCSFFFLIIATFWVLKPIKRGLIVHYFSDNPIRLLGLTFTGAEGEQIGKVLNVIAVYFVVILFTSLVRKFPRHHVVLIFSVMFGTALVFYASVIGEPNPFVVFSFFVFGDMFNAALVGLFWAFTNDIVTTEESKRTYGVIGLGGVVGGFTGATVVRSSVETVGRSPLLLIAVIPLVLITFIAYKVHRRDAQKKTAIPRRGPLPRAGGQLRPWKGHNWSLARGICCRSP
jgi:AAA family ATP:ADP antiporter